MKKLFSIFLVAMFSVLSASQAAVNVKKAASVSTKKAEAVESATSLLPAVIGLVGSVQELNNRQQQLTAECEPTSDEIRTVNELVQEWAKISERTAADVMGAGVRDCTGGYATFVENADDNEVCYETFGGNCSGGNCSDSGTVWEGFPKASSARICEPGSTKNCKIVSNMYEIFDKVSFSMEDYTASEYSKIAKLLEKAERCSPSKMNAAKRELYGGFLTQTLGSVGQSTGASGTASVIQAVSSMGGSGSIQSLLPSIGQMALQSANQ